MSSVYSLEPPTKGKVCVKTSLGELDIELWPKEAPKACRNFVQLCMEGYYDKAPFHRVIKDFMIQGGDPTGTGSGGETIYGGPFEDEFHSRLQFRRRALVACANEANKPDSNGSQFFITLGRSDWLTKKNTIFGTVTGETVYNLVKFNELDVDETDRPTDPPHIVSTEVIWNPFDDIVPRTQQQGASSSKAKAKESSRGRVRNKNLLSFGDEEGGFDDDGDDFGFGGGPGGFQRRQKKYAKTTKPPAKEASVGEGEGAEQSDAGKGVGPSAAAGASEGGKEKIEKIEKDEKAETRSFEQRMVDRMRQMGADMAGPAGKAEGEVAAEAAEPPKEPKAKERKPLFKKASGARPFTAKRKRSSREEDTLAKLERFTSGLRTGKKEVSGNAAAASVGKKQNMPAAWRLDDYLAMKDDGGGLNDLKSHVFKHQETRNEEMLRKDDIDDYVVLDPLMDSKGKGGKWKGKGKRR